MTDGLTVGILSPGDMGEAVGRVLGQHGVRVIAALEGRSERTRALAAAAGIEDVGTLVELVRQAGQVLSILVPGRAEEAAHEIAGAIAETGSGALIVDCNAVAASTSERAGAAILAAGGRYVDASIIGPPPRRPGVTRFYASGADAPAFAALSEHGLDIRVLDGPIGRASSIKTAYASLTKGLTALGAEMFISARAHGLLEPLLEELALSQPQLLPWLERSLGRMPQKAHRFVGEMEEHGRAFADQGLTPLMMNGAADLYRFVATTPPGQESPEDAPERSLDELISALAAALDQG